MPSACFEQVVATNCWGLPSFDGLSHRSSCDKLTTGLGCPKGTLNGEGVMANILGEARAAKYDEFYTQYADIEREINAYLEYNENCFRDKVVLLPCDDPDWSNFTKYFAQNFERLGLKKLISTSYAQDSKPYKLPVQLSLFEINSPDYDESKTNSHGKIFTLTRRNKKVDINDLKWKYLEGDGDYQSAEVCALRDEADIIITNPPFSKFREFLAWIVGANKGFVIIGNINALTYKEVFPLIRDNKLWLGNGFNKGNAYFGIPSGTQTDYAQGVYDESTGLVKFRNCCWFTNLEHGRRHQPLELMTMDKNIKFSKHKDVRGNNYNKYDNYDAIEVPFTDAIPSDYEGVMGVPVSFLDKYCPEQFEIIGLIAGNIKGLAGIESSTGKDGPYINGKLKYGRILIKKRG